MHQDIEGFIISINLAVFKGGHPSGVEIATKEELKR